MQTPDCPVCVPVSHHFSRAEDPLPSDRLEAYLAVRCQRLRLLGRVCVVCQQLPAWCVLSSWQDMLAATNRVLEWHAGLVQEG